MRTESMRTDSISMMAESMKTESMRTDSIIDDGSQDYRRTFTEDLLAKEEGLEERKDTGPRKKRAPPVPKQVINSSLIGNFMFIFGCQPAYGVRADSKFVKNVIDLFAKNFDPEGGHIMLPDCFARVISSDATFETVSSNLSRKLKLRRKDKSVGAKTILYVVDSAKNDNETKEIRAIVSNFFKKNLGFTQAEIIAIDRGAFIKDGEFWKPKFGRGL